MTKLSAQIVSDKARARVDSLLLVPDQETIDQELLDAVIQSLWDLVSTVRRAAVDVLGQLAEFRNIELPEKVLDRVLELCEDQDPQLRAESMGALVLVTEKSKASQRLAALLKGLEDTDTGVRQEAAAALGDLGEPQAIDKLSQALQERQYGVVFESAFALANLGSPAGLEVLCEALSHKQRRLDACEALRRLKSPQALPALEKLSQKKLLPWPDRLTCWATIYVCGDTSTAERIIERTKAFRKEERIYALALLGTHKITEGHSLLKTIAGEKGHKMRSYAVHSLGAFGDAADISLLQRIAQEDTSSLQAEAVHALLRFEPQQYQSTIEGLKPVLAQESLDLVEKAFNQE